MNKEHWIEIEGKTNCLHHVYEYIDLRRREKATEIKNERRKEQKKKRRRFAISWIEDQKIHEHRHTSKQWMNECVSQWVLCNIVCMLFARLRYGIDGGKKIVYRMAYGICIVNDTEQKEFALFKRFFFFCFSKRKFHSSPFGIVFSSWPNTMAWLERIEGETK